MWTLLFIASIFAYSIGYVVPFLKLGTWNEMKQKTNGYSALKFYIDPQNRHIWKEIHFPIHPFWLAMLNFQGVSEDLCCWIHHGILLVVMKAKNTNILQANRFTSPETCLKIKLCLGGGFKYFLFSPLFGEDSHFDYILFFRWVETTNQLLYLVYHPKNPQGPSNGGVNEPVWLAGVFWGPQIDVTFEGSGFLGRVFLCGFANHQQNQLEKWKSPLFSNSSCT